MKTFLLFFLLFTGVTLSAQNKYYQGPNGKVFDEKSYNEAKAKLSLVNKVEEEITGTRTSKDSIIKIIKLTITPLNENKESFSPYILHEKKIGQHFPIEKFKKANGDFYKKEELKGKPTLINFWFTKCPPCITEIPNLNILQGEYSKDVNFIAITFDDQQKVKEFLIAKPLNFIHITGARTQLTDMGVVAYPMNLILDTNGNILNVFGEISQEEDQIIRVLNHLLKK
jgi:cytochrome c biogenesis protein CcmG/thiol:disulfide interchange protein DsbE